MRNLNACTAVLICVAVSSHMLTGCRPATSKGWGVRSIDWSLSRAGETSVPGVDEAAVQFGTYGNQTAVVFWGDCGGSFAASWDKTRQAVKYEGRLTTHDGRTVVVDCYTPDGLSGQVTVDGHEFPLERGRVFLISTRGAATAVKQLARDDLKPELSDLKQRAREDADIHDFFAASAEQAASGNPSAPEQVPTE
jgi:hypothetical protein